MSNVTPISEAKTESGMSKGTLFLYNDSIEYVTVKGKKQEKVYFAEMSSVCVKYDNAIHIKYGKKGFVYFWFEAPETASKWCKIITVGKENGSVVLDDNGEILQNKTATDDAPCEHKEKIETPEGNMQKVGSVVKNILRKGINKFLRLNALGKVIAIDVLLWVIFFLFEENILPDSAGSLAGFFGLIAIMLLVFILAIISGIVGADTSKIGETNERERQIRRDTRIAMDEARRHNENWKNARK